MPFLWLNERSATWKLNKKLLKLLDILLYGSVLLCWQVYLLASVGRPSEMNYVFDELKENNQFDLLLSDELCKVSHCFS